MVTAHVPLRNPGPETEQNPEAYAAKNPFDDPGARLVKLGMADLGEHCQRATAPCLCLRTDAEDPRR